MAGSRKYHISPYKPVPARPSAGGKLMSNVSNDSVGIFNYRINRDWRRVLDRLRRSEGYEWFWPNTAIPMGQQPFPNYPKTSDPITLTVMARQPNGRTAFVCGTPTTIYRFFSLDDGAYYTGDGTADAYYTETGPDTPYYDDNPGVWIVIGSGFSPFAQRWEAVSLNGFLILNNGVDLPMTYEVQDFSVKPIYELRENGIASVGNISVCNDLLLCADISEINSEGASEFPIPSGTATATLANGIVTCSQSFFTAAWVGQLIQFENGTTSFITGFTSETKITVADTVDTISTGQLFTIVSPAPTTALTTLLSTISSNGVTTMQQGNFGPTVFTATLIGGAVSSAVAAFGAGDLGRTILFTNGISGVINFYIDPQNVTVDNLTDTVNPGLSFWLNNPGTADFTVTASAPIFDPSQVGQLIIWDNGNIRTIKSFIDNLNVVVDSNSPVPPGVFAFNNPSAYAPFTDESQISRIQYRIINGIPGSPRRWASNAPGSIQSGSRLLALQYPMASLQELIGQQLIVLGAGLLGGNLTATMISIDEASLNIVLDTPAQTTVVDSPVQAFDAVGSLVSFTDLQDDGSGIVAMLDLLGYLIVYKDTSIWVGQFTGQAGDVFTFNAQTHYSGSKTLYYRNTLIKVNAKNADFHLFAGRNSFYRFDMITQQPTEVLEGELCKDIFFNAAGLEGNNGSLGPELVPNQNYPGGSDVFLPVTIGNVYFYSMGANDLVLANGGQMLAAGTSGQMVALATPLRLTPKTPSVKVTASLRLVDNIGVFAADNPITKEVFFCFPNGPGPDYALRYDYFNGQISSTSGRYTSAAAIKRPSAGIQTSPSEDWFVMGLSNGTVVRYGLTDSKPLQSGTITVSQSGNVLTSSGQFFEPDLVIGKSIQFPDLSVVNVTGFTDSQHITVGGPATTRAATLFSVISASWHRLGQPYASVIQTGLESFGTTFGEKDLEAIVVILASGSANSTLLLEFLGCVNPVDNPPVLGSKLITNPLATNAIGSLFRRNWFADRLTVNGINNPTELIEQIYNIAGVNSKAFIQR